MGSVTQKKIRNFNIREERKRARRKLDRFFIGSQIRSQIVFQEATFFILPDEQFLGECFHRPPGWRMETVDKRCLRV
jgi:hypothetical protein